MFSALVATIHFLAAFVVGYATVTESQMLSRAEQGARDGSVGLTHSDWATRLRQVSRYGGLAAAVTIAAGLIRVFVTEKGAAFYAASPFFWLKLILFLGVGVLGAVNARYYGRWNTSNERSTVPAAELAQARSRATIQLWLFAVLVLSASLMAKGVGL